jgi:hypothetical protein
MVSLFVIAVAALLPNGCGSSAPRPAERDEAAAESSTGYAPEELASMKSEAASDEGVRMLAPSAAPARKQAMPSSSPASEPPPSQSPSPSAPPASAAPASAAPASAAPASAASARMVHYEGGAVLRSTEPEKTIDSAIALVRAAGGFLESRWMTRVKLRVPAKDFDSLFQRLTRLAELVSYNVGAEDITESYQDTDLRLKVVVSTLQRLEALVKQARTEAQKMLLLERLRQLREEREVLEARKRELSGLARFATITLQVDGRDPAVAGDAWRWDVKDFLWIHGLDPFNDRRFQGMGTLKFKAPDGMAVTSKRRPWRATGAQGAEFWAAKMEVAPRADSRFWSEAVRLRLQGAYKAVDTSEAGGFRFCRFRAQGPAPYFYWVGVRARGDDLDLVEIYFPTEEMQNRQIEAVLASVKQGPL